MTVVSVPACRLQHRLHFCLDKSQALRPTLTPIVTSGGDGRDFGEKKCSQLLMKVTTTFVLVACAKALQRVVGYV